MLPLPLASRLSSDVVLRGVLYDEQETDRWRSWLSEEEQACMADFGSKKRCRAFLMGRAVARRLLSDHLDVPPAAVPLRRAEDGAVDVSAGDWRVSIAHSGDRALAAAARGPVGSDVEHVKPRDPAVARFLLRPDERNLLDRLPYDRNWSLLLLWSLKEATLKARRSGFRVSPKALRLTVDADAQTATAVVEGAEQWALSFAAWDDYWTAVATPETTRSA